MPVPITLNIYNEDNEIANTYSRNFVPWKLLKKAIALRKVANKVNEEITADDMDAIAGYVIEFFGNGMTLEELDNGADMSEMLTVIRAVMARAAGIVDPTIPAA